MVYYTCKFLSTLSLRRATSSIDDLEPSTTHFYPRSPCGERLIITIITTCIVSFLSTLSLRRATKLLLPLMRGLSFLSTLSLRRATDTLTDDVSTGGFLSTLSLRRATIPNFGRYIGSNRPFLSTLSLRRATELIFFFCVVSLFLSTLSLRRATSAKSTPEDAKRYFYPRSPCGERPKQHESADDMYRFLSTLSLRRATGHDLRGRITQRFLSTLSLRRATWAWMGGLSCD